MNNIASSQGRFPAIEEAVTPLLLDSQNLYKEFRKIKKEHFTSKRQRKETAKLAEIWRVELNIRRAIQPLAQPLCLEICEGVCKRLPREIRDTIYEFLYAHDTIYVGPEYFTKTTRPCIASRKAHIWDDVYVGQGMQREIVESWYRTTLFYFYDKAANVEVIERFLRTDRWDLGIEPKDFICHTRVELWINSVLHHRRCCVVKDAGPKLIEALKNFENLPNHVEFLIRIHTYDAPNTECMSKEELKDAIRVVVKELEKLHKEGHRLVIQWPDLKNAELSWKKDPFSVDGWIKKLEVAACLAPAEPDEKSLSDEEETAVWEWNDGVLDAGNISFAGI